MTLDEIRGNPDLVKRLTSAMASRHFQIVLEMLIDAHPMRFVDTAPVTASSAEKKLGMIEGYQLVLDRLRLCTQYQSLPGPMPVATFQDPSTEE